jgi:hypothetical protein
MKKEDLTKVAVTFDEAAHTYTTADNRVIPGVTPAVEWLFPETYRDIPEDVMQRAAAEGTMVHKQCQMADEYGVVVGEAVKYRDIMDKAGLKTVANEYLVSDGRVASKIDVVCEGVALVDIKRTSQIHEDRVSLQLSIYALLFESNNPGKDVKHLYVAWLPKERYGKPEVRELRRVPSEVVSFILDEYLAGHDYAEARRRFDKVMHGGEDGTHELPDIAEYVAIEHSLKVLEERQAEIKDGWFESMKAGNIKKFKDDRVTVSIKQAGVRRSLDSKKLQAEFPGAYEACMKESSVAESIQVKVV